MFDSPGRLSEQIRALLAAVRDAAGGRFCCLLTRTGLLFESPDAEGQAVLRLKRLLEERCQELFDLPRAMAGGGPARDLFDGWDDDELWLGFINGRVVLVVACPAAEGLDARIRDALTALVDRLFRYDETLRMDERGRGFFFSRPRLETVVVTRARG